jgi:hypothetical protein
MSSQFHDTGPGSAHGLESSHASAHCIAEDQAQRHDAEANTAAIRFFRNPDLCTQLCRMLVAVGRADSSHTGKLCKSIANMATLLAFRGVTRQSWAAVMLEHSSRSALNLAPRTEATEGILMYIDTLKLNPYPERYPRPEEFNDNLYPMISYNETDAAAQLALEADGPSDVGHYARRPLARIITHHPAAVHVHTYPPFLISSLCIPAEQYHISAALPLAREMFLTQPPQKAIRFGIRYQYQPAVRNFFWVINEDGVRFGDLAAHFEGEPELMYQAIHSGHGLYRYRRWLENSEMAKLDRIVWDFEKAIVRGHPYDEHARKNLRERGETGV